MSAEACNLNVSDVDDIREALSEQRDGITRILAEADGARNGLVIDRQLLVEAVGRIATGITTIEDTLDLRVGDGEPAERKGANDG